MVRECPQPTLCWVFADREGHIGMQGGGWFPKRGEGNSGLLPVPAWDERNHWHGRLPTTAACRASTIRRKASSPRPTKTSIRPAARMLVTLPVPDYRKRRIVERLRQLPHATVTDMQALQYDVVSLQARDLLAVFLAALAGRADQDAAGRLGLQLPRRQPRSHAILPTVSQRAAWKFSARRRTAKGGGIGWRRMLYLSAASVSRRWCSRRSIGCWRTRLRSGGRTATRRDLIRTRGRATGRRARSAVGRDQRLPLRESVHSGERRRPRPRLSHRQDADARLPRHAVSGPLADDRQARNDVRPVVSLRRPTWAPTKPGPTCPAAPAKAASRRFTKSTSSAGKRATTNGSAAGHRKLQTSLRLNRIVK